MRIDARQDVVLVAARFPRDLYEQLHAQAQKNMRSVGKECVVLCQAALQEREAGKQKQNANIERYQLDIACLP